MSHILSNRIEVWGFHDGITIFSDGSLGTAIEFKPFDVGTNTDKSINSLQKRVVDFLNALPAGLDIQFVQDIVPGNESIFKKHRDLINNSVHPLIQKVSQSRLSRFEELDKQGKVPCFRTFLIVRKKWTNEPVKRSLKTIFWGKTKSKEISENNLKKEIKLFSNLVIGIKSGLRNLSIDSNQISEENLLKLIYDQWNPSRPVEGNFRNLDYVRDDLVFSDVTILPDGFYLGRMLHKVITLKVLPDQSWTAMAEILRGLPFGSRLLVNIKCLDQAKQFKDLQLQRRISYSMAMGKKGVADLDSEAKLKDIEDLLGKHSLEVRKFSS